MMSNESPHYSNPWKESTNARNYLLIQPHGPMGQLSSGEEFAKDVEEHFRADAGTK